MMKKGSRKKGVSMAILTADCDRAFVVANDKAESFRNQKRDPKVFKKINAAATKLQKNMILHIFQLRYILLNI